MRKQDLVPLEQYGYHARGKGQRGERTRLNVFESPMEDGRHTTFMIETDPDQNERGAIIVDETGQMARVNFLSSPLAEGIAWMARKPFRSQQGRKLEMPITHSPTR